MALKGAVFVDRDGVICRNRRDHVKTWQEFAFVPGAVEALVRLASSNLYIIVVTNQAIINRRIASEQSVIEIHDRMVERVGAAGGRIDGVLYCPHREDENCSCRKPRPGLILEAAARHGIDVSESYLIGDAESDLVAGRVAGCVRRYLVLTGRGPLQLVRCLMGGELGFRVVLNLGAAVEDILKQHRTRAEASSFGE
jgi:D-glycero-D-manno-heptose 1,7-bisphosphate phosphatase